jgi:hypothetical protein
METATASIPVPQPRSATRFPARSPYLLSIACTRCAGHAVCYDSSWRCPQSAVRNCGPAMCGGVGYCSSAILGSGKTATSCSPASTFFSLGSAAIDRGFFFLFGRFGNSRSDKRPRGPARAFPLPAMLPAPADKIRRFAKNINVAGAAPCGPDPGALRAALLAAGKPPVSAWPLTGGMGHVSCSPKYRWRGPEGGTHGTLVPDCACLAGGTSC